MFDAFGPAQIAWTTIRTSDSEWNEYSVEGERVVSGRGTDGQPEILTDQTLRRVVETVHVGE